MLHLVTGASARTVPAATAGAEARTYAKVHIVKSRTMQRDIVGCEVKTLDCDGDVARSIITALKSRGAVVCDLELDSVEFGRKGGGGVDTRVSIVSGEVRPEMAFRFTSTGIEFGERKPPAAAGAK